MPDQSSEQPPVPPRHIPSVLPCPSCERASARAVAINDLRVTIQYYRCSNCGHLWHTEHDAEQ
jgi:transposase-like protein